MESTIQLSSADESRLLFGAGDRNLKLVRDACSVEIVARNGLLRIKGEKEAVEQATWVFQELLDQIRAGRIPPPGEIERLLGAKDHPEAEAGERSGSGRFRPIEPDVQVRPRTPGQERYVQEIKKHDIVFGIGPAGTGKTYLAVAMAIAALKSGRVRRIVLTRPAVEAGEKLGFLPGDFLAKVNPYVRPLYDALSDILNWSQIQKYIEKDIIEVVPLAYMRGRTLDRAFIILDEAQNTTAKQMKMFLTRMGHGSKAVITGDITQVDLDEDVSSGLVAVQEVLAGVRNICFCYLEREDIVRHHLVQDIVDAYERTERARDGASGETSKDT